LQVFCNSYGKLTNRIFFLSFFLFFFWCFSHFKYLSIHLGWWTLRLFHFLAAVNSTAMNIGV
jgi:hypothetical protein